MNDPAPPDLLVAGNAMAGLDPFTDKLKGYRLDNGQPFEAPWISHIEGNLYQGGGCRGLVLPDLFLTVVELSQSARYTVHHEGVHRYVAVMDDENIEPDPEVVLDLAGKSLAAMSVGPVLIHCQAGLNRSGLIAAATLVLSGYSPEQAIHLLRQNRSSAVLHNKTFERFVLNFRPTAAP